MAALIKVIYHLGSGRSQCRGVTNQTGGSGNLWFARKLYKYLPFVTTK